MCNPQDQQWLEGVLQKTKDKLAWVSERSANKIPYTTLNGVHDDRSIHDKETPDNGLCWWTNGFWGGMMWLLYHETGSERYAEIARYTENALDDCFDSFYGLHHDVGFMWLPTAVADYRLTGNLDGRRRGLHAANLLAGRFNPVGRFIRAWNDRDTEDTRGWAIIDCLLNIPLLYWASEETGDPRYGQIARLHADTVMEHFVRPDGSVIHIVEFNPDTGAMVKSHGGQGCDEGSSWTRGQTWGLYGFVMSYLHTKNPAYLNTAKQIAHYFIANIPESGLIPVDFRQPPEPAWEDSTAAAIAASGLLELAKLVPEQEQALYRNAALKLLRTLDAQRCDWSRENDCILTHCTAAYHRPEHHFSIIYGDYFFLEALLKLKDNDFFVW